MFPKTYFIKTFGCQMNVSDSERIAGFLEAHGLKPAKYINHAKLVIFNTCGVRQSAEDRVYGQIHNVRKQESENKNHKTKKIIILTGCLSDRKDVQKRLKDKVDLFCEIKDLFKKNVGVQFIEPENEKNKSGFNKSNPYKLRKNYLSILPKYTDTQTAYVPIMTGCNNFCSYCVVPYARGREKSRSPQNILKEIASLAKNGYKEITLLGQNVNSYKYRINSSLSFPRKRESSKKSRSNDWIPAFAGMTLITFPKILSLLVKSFSDINFKFLTSHPKDFSDDLIKVIAQNKNISREIHLPLQSGSDKILKLMNRPYTRKKYMALIQKIKKKIPKASFTTDVIVGFPGETKIDFQETVRVFKKVKYNEAYINKYSPRPGTAAEKLGDPISWGEKKRREKILIGLITNSCHSCPLRHSSSEASPLRHSSSEASPLRHSSSEANESGNPEKNAKEWIPAFAGMTNNAGMTQKNDKFNQ